jgi:hypothetical protein
LNAAEIPPLRAPALARGARTAKGRGFGAATGDPSETHFGKLARMTLEELAARLTDKNRIGLSDALAERLGFASPEIARGRMMALADLDRSFLGVYLLAAYVIDDTDFWGDGEIYWWSIPTMVGADGSAVANGLYGIPNGEPPHKVGSLEWMTNLSLNDPPLLAMIPPEERVAACTVRLAFYDDDGKPADLAAAMASAMESFAAVCGDPRSSADQIVTPVRDAIFKGLKAQEDDILIDQDFTIRRGNVVQFSNGMLGSLMNSMIRVYYFVRDEATTEQFGPITLHKGQTETVKFSSPLRGGGRLALFARGANVGCSAFGELSLDMPFMNKVIDTNHEPALANGFSVSGLGPSKFVAYYTPPSR